MAIATPKSTGGYEYSFIDTPHDRFICKICHLPSRDPYLSECCGHLFCKSCLENVKKASAISNACPICRNEEFKTFSNKAINREVRGLHIYCINKEKGCEWQGELNDINNHLGNNDGCSFEMIQCEYYSVGCKRAKVARKDMKKHDNEKMKEHLLMTKSELTSTKVQLNDTKVQLDETKAQLDDALKQINSLAALVKPQLCPTTGDTDGRSVQLDAMATVFKSVCPATFKMSGYHHKKENNVEWYSEPFYTHKKGYRMCLCVDAAGSGSGEGTHLSVYLYLMKGSHDDELTWPLRGEFEIKLLNQISDSEHRSDTMTYVGDINGADERVIEGDQSEEGWGIQFISNRSLHKTTPTCQYLRDDHLFFQVTKL